MATLCDALTSKEKSPTEDPAPMKAASCQPVSDEGSGTGSTHRNPLQRNTVKTTCFIIKYGVVFSKSKLVSILSTFHAHIFGTKVLCADFLKLKFGFIIFGKRISAQKLHVKC